MKRAASCLSLLGVALLGQAVPAAAQTLEPKAVRLRISGAYLGLGAEAEREQDDYSDGTQSTYERTFMGPVFGLRAVGSFYHPRFMRFSFDGELWPGYTSETTTTGSQKIERNESRFLGNYNANLLVLARKPYHTLVSLNQNYSYRDFDAFTRAEVNSVRLGLSTGYRSGPVPFTLDVWRRHEDSTGQNIDSTLDETGVTFNARHPRATGETTFEYRFLNYDRTDYGVGGSDMENTFSLSDRETFGSRQQIRLESSISYSVNDYSEGPGDNLYAWSTLDVEHTPTLTSFYNLSYSRSTSTFSNGDTESDGLVADASLRHQLYESLTSTLRLEASTYSSTGDFDDTVGGFSDSQTTRYGGGLTEAYTKRLGSIGRLSLSGSVMMEHNIQDNAGDYIVRTDESHVFSSDSAGFGSDSFFLSLPNVDQGSIVITDGQNSQPAYREGRDYTVVQNGALTEIRRPGSSTIPRNANVLVDYRALSSPSGDYDSITSYATLRIDLWNGLLAVYARTSALRNNAPPELVVQDFESYAAGVESTWRWLRAGAEVETYDSNFTSYDTVRFFQSISFQPTQATSLSINFVESQTQYIDAARDEQNYYAMALFRSMITRRLSVDLDAGISVRQGEGVDQTLAKIRPSLNFRIGRITLKAGYNYEYGEYLNTSQQQRHFAFITLRRDF